MIKFFVKTIEKKLRLSLLTNVLFFRSRLEPGSRYVYKAIKEAGERETKKGSLLCCAFSKEKKEGDIDARSTFQLS